MASQDPRYEKNVAITGIGQSEVGRPHPDRRCA